MAQSVFESNYLHIDPDMAIVADGRFPAERVAVVGIRFPRLEIGGRIAVSPTGALSIAPPRGGPGATVAALFEEDVCVFGAQVTVEAGLEGNSVEIRFRFVDRTGDTVAEITRFPAGGTTRQAFSAQSFAFRVAAVEVTSAHAPDFALSHIRALPCALQLS